MEGEYFGANIGDRQRAIFREMARKQGKHCCLLTFIVEVQLNVLVKFSHGQSMGTRKNAIRFNNQSHKLSGMKSGAKMRYECTRSIPITKASASY
jgi:hypothetical protein